MFATKVLTLILVVAGSKAQNGINITSNTENEQVSTTKNQTESQTTSNVTVFTTVNNSNTSMTNTDDFNPHDLFKDVTESIQELPGMILFGTGCLMGIVLTTAITCITNACQRDKKKRSSYQLGDVEMNTRTSTKVEGDAIPDEEAAEGEVGSAGQLLLNGDGAPKEAEYSDLDFSAAKNRKSPEVRTIPETEYAEIKIEHQAEKAEEDGEILEREDENKEEILRLPPEEAAREDFSEEFPEEFSR